MGHPCGAILAGGSPCNAGCIGTVDSSGRWQWKHRASSAALLKGNPLLYYRMLLGHELTYGRTPLWHFFVREDCCTLQSRRRYVLMKAACLTCERACGVRAAAGSLWLLELAHKHMAKAGVHACGAGRLLVARAAAGSTDADARDQPKRP